MSGATGRVAPGWASCPASAASPAVPAHRPYLIAAALVVAGLYQASQPREDWLTACRRAGAAAGAAPPGYRAALVCGRAHALRSIGANAGLVVALAAGA